MYQYRANWRLDLLPLPIIFFGRSCMHPMVQVLVHYMYIHIYISVSDMFQLKTFWLHPKKKITFRSTPTVPRFTNCQFNINLIYRWLKTRARAPRSTRMHNYIYPSGFQQESHKNVHKNLINHNFRRSMQGENHRIRHHFSPKLRVGMSAFVSRAGYRAST